ncbi:MAG: hypothetical protein LAO78_03010 [Acidobacteriia bacterium]|nr:hypothetical protein [Terriglobia bacterium]
MKSNLIRVMAIAILATSMSAFAQQGQTKQGPGQQSTNAKKHKKNPDLNKTGDEMKNDPLLQIYG